jgi:hypothetical protein
LGSLGVNAVLGGGKGGPSASKRSRRERFCGYAAAHCRSALQQVMRDNLVSHRCQG